VLLLLLLHACLLLPLLLLVQWGAQGLLLPLVVRLRPAHACRSASTTGRCSVPGWHTSAPLLTLPNEAAPRPLAMLV
jgi:hypothetical protein